MYSKLMRLLWYTNRSRPHILRLTRRRDADHSWMTKKACRRKMTQSECTSSEERESMGYWKTMRRRARNRTTALPTYGLGGRRRRTKRPIWKATRELLEILTFFSSIMERDAFEPRS